METRIINRIITIMAVIGVIIFIGAVGHSDYMSECHKYYPLSSTVKNMLFGMLLIVPAIIRNRSEQ